MALGERAPRTLRRRQLSSICGRSQLGGGQVESVAVGAEALECPGEIGLHRHLLGTTCGHDSKEDAGPVGALAAARLNAARIEKAKIWEYATTRYKRLFDGIVER